MNTGKHEIAGKTYFHEGTFYAAESDFHPGSFVVMRRSEENPGSWDRTVLTSLTESQATAIAGLLTTSGRE